MSSTPLGERIVDVSAATARLLADHATRLGSPPPAVDRVRVYTWSPASARKSRRRLFVRVDVDAEPVAVAKLPLSEDDLKLCHEFAVLSSLPDGLGFDRPRPLAEIDGGFSMTYLPGIDLPAAPGLVDGPEQAWKVLAPVLDAVAALHRVPIPEGVGGLTNDQVAVAAQYMRSPLTGVPHADRALRAALIAPTHGDLGPWNVRYNLDDDTVCVLDFEDYRPAGIAGIDVVNLLVTMALPVFPDYRKRGFNWLYDQVFVRNTWFRDVVARGVLRYAERTEQRAGDVLDLTPLMCRWLIERIESEGRDSSGLFYRTFTERYLAARPDWIGRLDG